MKYDKTKPSLSVIVPIYNSEEYLHQCIGSILKQDYPNMEIILVDDGSTDRSGLICDDYSRKFSNVTVIHKKNGGLSDARNVGLDVAIGDYISFIDSDDYLAKNIYNKIFSENVDGDVDIIGMGRVLVFDDGHKKKMYCHDEEITLDRESYLKSVLTYQNTDMSVCDKIFKKKLLEGVKFPVGYLSEDILVLPFICKYVQKVVLKGEPGYAYRQRSGSITKTFSKKYIDTYWEILKNKKYIEEFRYHVEDEYDRFCNSYIVHIGLLYQSSLYVDKKDGDEIKKLLRKSYLKIIFEKDYPVRLKILSSLLLMNLGGVYIKCKEIVRHLLKI